MTPQKINTLRERFFKECVETKTAKLFFGEIGIAEINKTPVDIFEWFVPYLSELKEERGDYVASQNPHLQEAINQIDLMRIRYANSEWIEKMLYDIQMLIFKGMDYVASDKSVSEVPCVTPLYVQNNIEQLTKESLSALGFVFEKIGHNDFELQGVFHDEYGIEINWYEDNTFGFPYGSDGNVMDLKSMKELVTLRNLLINKTDI